MAEILPADMMSVHGLSVRNRLSGLGAPFVAVEKQNKNLPVVRSFPGTVTFYHYKNRQICSFIQLTDTPSSFSFQQ